MKTLLSILLCLFFVGCESQQDADIKNNYSLSHPAIIGKTEEGLTIKRYTINYPDFRHYVYVVEGKTTSSNNYLSGGKNQRNEVNTIVK